MLRTVVPILLLALPLAACGDGPSTSITLNASDAAGNVVAGIENGQMAFNVPGFSGKLKLPKFHLRANNFDMNGVHLYPGSTISGMNIDAHDRPGKDDDGSVRVTFESPATAAAVRDWFEEKLTAADFKIKPVGDGLVGTTNENKRFRLDLAPVGSDKAKGAITIG